MNKNQYVSRKRLEKHQAQRKALMISNIEAKALRQTQSANRLRYVGLGLVQGSSAVVLMDFSMTLYWAMLWSGLLCYFVPSIVFFKEDNRVYKMTKKKYQHGLGSSHDTVMALAEKCNRERVYIIGNAIGLILVGYNLILTLS